MASTLHNIYKMYHKLVNQDTYYHIIRQLLNAYVNKYKTNILHNHPLS